MRRKEESEEERTGKGREGKGSWGGGAKLHMKGEG